MDGDDNSSPHPDEWKNLEAALTKHVMGLEGEKLESDAADWAAYHKGIEEALKNNPLVDEDDEDEEFDPNKNFNTGKQMEIVKNDVRPVVYRHKGLQKKREEDKRTEEQVANEKIPQYHLELPGNTEFSEVPVMTLGQTLQCYLKASKPFYHTPHDIHDDVVAIIVEYDRSATVLCFEEPRKEPSDFPKSWWKSSFNNSGELQEAKKHIFRIKDDNVLRDSHFRMTEPVIDENSTMLPSDSFSHLQRIIDSIQPRLVSRRQTDDVILDSTYFVREFYLQKKYISFRITSSADIPSLCVPPALGAGYFPASATKEKDQIHYLKCRYKEAQKEYFNLSYHDIKPPPEFYVDDITGEELYKFHCMGRHIHGFFLVWQTTESFFEDEGGNLRGKRYLVDMFFKLKFPLDVNYNRWEPRLKLAFDRLIVYNLHFSEILRVNRPVFDPLVKNPSIFKPLTQEEMVKLIEENEMDIEELSQKLGSVKFYEFGKEVADYSYLSAFFIISGASKVLKPNQDQRKKKSKKSKKKKTKGQKNR